MNGLQRSAILLAFAFFTGNFSATAQNAPKLTDPQIAHVAVTANQIDISYARVAKHKSKNAAVLKFAATMASDHQAVIDQAVVLAEKLKITPKGNAVSKKLLADAEKTRKRLNATPAKNFDKAYIDNEVAYHKAVIGTVETILIPQVQNRELKALLQKVDPTFKAHLQHAEMVQSQMAGNAHGNGK